MRAERSLPGCGLLVAGVLLAGGCASEPEIPPTPPLPEITDAKQVRGQPPCSMLTGEQLPGFGLTGPGTPTQAEEGPRCSWRGADGLSLTVTLFIDGGGLATLAENSEPTTARVRIDGYPALETFTAGGRFCQYDVAVAPQQVLIAALENGAPDSCTALQSVIPVILDGLPPQPS